MTLPCLPPWAELHPVVVHFPIALLSCAALLAALAAVPGRFAAGLRAATAIVMLAGTAAAFAAVGTGKAAADAHRHLPPVPAALAEQHEQLGEATRTVFGTLALAYLGVLALPLLVRRALPPRLVTVIHLAFLACYLAGVIVLFRTAVLGGELVHRWGVRGITASEATATDDGDMPESPPVDEPGPRAVP